VSSKMVCRGHHDSKGHIRDDKLGSSCSHILVDSQASERPILPLQLVDLINSREK